MKVRLITGLLALALAAFAAAGCGDDDDDGGSAQENAPAETTTAETPTDTTGEDTGGAGEATELQIAADPGGALAFDKEALQAPAGEITIVMDNPSTLPHAVEIEGAGDEAVGETVNQGGKSEATATLEAGEYRYYCPVPGHGEAGMEGTLTVE
jgi:plastocyanin